MKKCLQALFLVVMMIFFSSILCTTPEAAYPEANACVFVQDFPAPGSFFEEGFGTGFLVNTKDNPYIMTNRHVLLGDKGQVTSTPMKVGVAYKDNRGYLTTAAIPVCYFKNIDIGILQLYCSPPDASFIKFSAIPYHLGDEVHYFGQPGVKGRMYLYSGKISCLNTPSKNRNKPTDAINLQATGGNSGAPIINEQGRCVGVMSGTIPGSTQSFFVGYKDIKYEFDKAGLGDILTGTFTGNLVEQNGGMVKCH